MNRHALGVLEFARVLDVVAGYAGSTLGRERVLALSPTDERPWIEREQSRVSACRALMHADARWAPERAPDLREALSRLRVEGASWNGTELLGGADRKSVV